MRLDSRALYIFRPKQTTEMPVRPHRRDNLLTVLIAPLHKKYLISQTPQPVNDNIHTIEPQLGGPTLSTLASLRVAVFMSICKVLM